MVFGMVLGMCCGLVGEVQQAAISSLMLRPLSIFIDLQGRMAWLFCSINDIQMLLFCLLFETKRSHMVCWLPSLGFVFGSCNVGSFDSSGVGGFPNRGECLYHCKCLIMKESLCNSKILYISESTKQHVSDHPQRELVLPYAKHEKQVCVTALCFLCLAAMLFLCF